MNKALHMVSFILVAIGGLNWLLVGLMEKDLFQLLGMNMADMVPKVVYILVGLATVYLLITHKKDCRMCGGSSNSSAVM